MYEPAEDSFFLADFLKNKFKENLNYLDMGTGSGILSEKARVCGVKDIIASDIDAECVNFVRKKGFNVFLSDLFKNICGKFDIISFNAPYLPKDKFDDKKDTTGGEKGDEIPLKFLKNVKRFLKKNGRAYILLSSHTPLDRIKKLDVEIVAKKKIFFEELSIFEMKN